MTNRAKQIVGLLLIAIFTAVLLAITFFPDSAGTNQQQFNALMFSLIPAVAGMVFIYLGRKEKNKSLKDFKSEHPKLQHNRVCSFFIAILITPPSRFEGFFKSY